MFTLVSQETVPLTRQLAAHISSLPAFVGDRDRTSAKGRQRIQWLQSLLAVNRLQSLDWATADLGGVQYRVNGGHTSLLFSNMNGTFPQGMPVNLQRYKCETLEDMALLHDKFDSAKSARTSADRLRARKHIYSELDPIAPTYVGKSLAGVAFHLTMTDSPIKPRDTDEKICLMGDYVDFIVWSADFVRNNSTAVVGVVGAIFATYEKDKEFAKDFWTKVCDQSHVDVNHPTRKLGTFLMLETAKTTGYQNRMRREWTPRAYYVKCLHAWNAARTGTTTDLKYKDYCQVPKIR